MTAFARVHITTEAQDDIRGLPDRDVQRAVIEALLEIENNLEFGPLLEVRGSTGDLRGCRKVYVDKVTPGKPRFRIVYWCSPDERRPRRARILAVGPRKSLAVYDTAAQRYNADRAAAGQPPSRGARTRSSAWTPQNERQGRTVGHHPARLSRRPATSKQPSSGFPS